MSILGGLLLLLGAQWVPVYLDLKPGSELALDLHAPVVFEAQQLGSGPLARTWAFSTSRAAAGTALWLPVGGRFRISCHGESVWCGSAEVTASSEAQTVALQAWPSATLRAGLQPPLPGVLLPPQVIVQGGFSKTQAGTAYSFSQTVPLVDGRLELRIPQDVLDVRLAVAGFGPIYLWDLNARGRRSISLPAPLKLWPGASFCGWVTDESTGGPVADVRVRLRPPALASMPDGSTAPKVERLAQEATTNARGFFQLPAAAAGTHRLELHDPEARRPVSVVAPLELAANSEACLEDLHLGSFLAVRLVLSPPADPLGRAWRLELWPVGAEPPGWWEAGRVADDTGVAAFEKVAPGPYSLRVHDGDGRPVASHELDLEEDGDVPVSVETVFVDGKILLHGEPLVARIGLWSTVQVEFTSNAEGEFQGWLAKPRFRTVRAEIAASTPRLEREEQVELKPAGDGVFKVEIDLEGPTAEGTVSNAAGKPVAEARVGAGYGTGTGLSTTTDASGWFRLEALPEKAGLLSAWHPTQGSSDSVALGPGAPAGEFSLVLEPMAELQGRVISARKEPVPGAQVMLLVPHGRAGRSSADTTDFQGRFKVEAPRGAQLAVVTVSAPTELLWSACVALPERGELRIELPAGPTGSLSLRNRFNPGTQRLAGTLIALPTQSGGLLLEDDLVQWAFKLNQLDPYGLRSPGLAELTVSQVAPGSYTALRSTLPWWDLARLACAGLLGAGEEWQTLVPGGEVTFEVDTRLRQDNFP